MCDTTFVVDSREGRNPHIKFNKVVVWSIPEKKTGHRPVSTRPMIHVVKTIHGLIFFKFLIVPIFFHVGRLHVKGIPVRLAAQVLRAGARSTYGL